MPAKPAGAPGGTSGPSSGCRPRLDPNPATPLRSTAWRCHSASNGGRTRRSKSISACWSRSRTSAWGIRATCSFSTYIGRRTRNSCLPSTCAGQACTRIPRTRSMRRVLPDRKTGSPSATSRRISTATRSDISSSPSCATTTAGASGSCCTRTLRGRTGARRASSRSPMHGATSRHSPTPKRRRSCAATAWMSSSTCRATRRATGCSRLHTVRLRSR